MTDLRTRIASAIQVRWLDLTLTDTWDENCLMLADAVIEELRPPYCNKCGLPHEGKCLRKGSIWEQFWDNQKRLTERYRE
jgi:hypothetical protein